MIYEISKSEIETVKKELTKTLRLFKKKNNHNAKIIAKWYVEFLEEVKFFNSFSYTPNNYWNDCLFDYIINSLLRKNKDFQYILPF